VLRTADNDALSAADLVTQQRIEADEMIDVRMAQEDRVGILSVLHAEVARIAAFANVIGSMVIQLEQDANVFFRAAFQFRLEHVKYVFSGEKVRMLIELQRAMWEYFVISQMKIDYMSCE
jgi:hypothetical protein